MQNLSAVLEAGGASLADVVKVNVFLTTMDNFPGMNEVYDEMFKNTVPKPVSLLHTMFKDRKETLSHRHAVPDCNCCLSASSGCQS